MTEYFYRILNVFTRGEETLSGNPLCVFEDGASFDTETMQALARQFNLSETTFILPSEKASAHVRIFTPSFEMPFAGHPTLGTAQVCRSLGLGGNSLQLEMQAGIIPVEARGRTWRLRADSPSFREMREPRAELAAALGLAAADVAERPLWLKAGREQLIVPLASEAAVRRAAPRAEALTHLESEDRSGMVYVFAPTAEGRAAARFFFARGSSVLEDPATGSAAGNLGGWILAMKRNLPCRLEISQGEHVKRPSSLTLEVDSERRIFVSGAVIGGRGAVAL